MDDRGQAIGIARLLLTLGVGAILLWIVAAVTAPLFKYANDSAPKGTQYAQATTWLQQGVDALPLYFLLVSVFGIVAYSVYSRAFAR